MDDPDQRRISLTLEVCRGATFTEPNDENLLRTLIGKLGFGWWSVIEVGNSPWLNFLSLHRGFDHIRHYALDLKDSMFHALARDITVERLDQAQADDLKRAVDSVVSLFPGPGSVQHIATS